MADETNALTALLRQLEAAHKANMEEIKAEKNREMADLKRMVTGVLERSASEMTCCQNTRPKRPTSKTQMNLTRATHATDVPTPAKIALFNI